MTFLQKVQSLERTDWGMSTDFVKTMQKIAELVKNERLEQHDIPDLLVISDMQFDEAARVTPTELFSRAGWVALRRQHTKRSWSCSRA